MALPSVRWTTAVQCKWWQCNWRQYIVYTALSSFTSFAMLPINSVSFSYHGHLILKNGCSYSEFVFETNSHCYCSMKVWNTGETGDIHSILSIMTIISKIQLFRIRLITSYSNLVLTGLVNSLKLFTFCQQSIRQKVKKSLQFPGIKCKIN